MCSRSFRDLYIISEFYIMGKLIKIDPLGASQRKVSGDESLASILLIRSFEGSWLLLPSRLAAPAKLAQINAQRYALTYTS